MNKTLAHHCPHPVLNLRKYVIFKFFVIGNHELNLLDKNGNEKRNKEKKIKLNSVSEGAGKEKLETQ